MTIHAQATVDEPSLVEAWQWHWRAQPSWKRWIYPVCGILNMLAAVYLMAFTPPPIRLAGPLLLVFGYVLVMRRRYQEVFLRRRAQRLPILGQLGQWTFHQDRMVIDLGGEVSKVRYASLDHVLRTPKGLLFYPQPDLYYWLPADAFENLEARVQAEAIIQEQARCVSLP